MTKRFGKGHAPFLKIENLENGSGGHRHADVTIEDVMAHSWDKGGVVDEAFSVGFVGKELRLRLNLTNEEFLVEVFGEPPVQPSWTMTDQALAMSEHMRGQRVTLFVDMTVRNPTTGGKGGLRLMRCAVPAKPAVETRTEEAFGSQVGTPGRTFAPESPDVPPVTDTPPVAEDEWAPTALPEDDGSIPF
jgi:hypothetical protein